MQITVTQTHDFPLRRRYVLELHSETGEVVSKGNFHLVKTGFGDGTVDTMLCCGVATPMQHRRHGYVRQIFDHALAWAAEQGIAVSLLHPFSFSYYEKFGYGKVSDHLIVRLPIRLLDTVPRFCDLRPWRIPRRGGRSYMICTMHSAGDGSWACSIATQCF